MRLKIVSDGTPKGTQVVNDLTRETLEGVSAIEWRITSDSYAQMVLTLKRVAVELTTEHPNQIQKPRKRRIELD